ncbi:FAD-binding oxidoreductase [Komagataeibacter xylinus]|mgnify:CR=1 FL=1|uniref:FAD-binding oxidoreductase n=1 Tax=Komagataeibacter xylinus TaxID=28448 RepID=A0A318PMF2_KOMXY|nr:FAD-binding oxidoreductase [Komagataeibacter xylinus]AZV39819.1 FAD-binding oxidoreductase [Komagataeibacter xylinus]PYD56760.1 FAD-binding oxidoreductase [Komagataeibacter xylinus]GBQ74139.1 glycine/D-amino acid oxidase [Komagataeibacter xylinus NBRC 15237]
MGVTNDPRSHGLWAQSACDAPVTGCLTQDTTADVAIIGAGYTGLSAALHLAGAGRKVVVLEGQEIGYGGSGRNVGLVNAGLWLMPSDVMRTLGQTYGERVLSLLGQGPEVVFSLVRKYGIMCEAEPTGTLHCAPDHAGVRNLQQREKEWQQLGAPVTLLGEGETRRLTGSNAYRAALLDARAGTIQPLSYARGLAAAAMAEGAEIHTASPVSSVYREDGGWLVRTPRGSVKAQWVIVATNTYTDSLWPEIREEQIHLPYFNIATRPLPPACLNLILPKKQGVWDTREVLTSFRLDQAGRLVVGSVGSLGMIERNIHRQWAHRALTRIYPMLRDITFESEWYGRIGMTVDSVPRYHRLDEQVLSISGFNGRGISPGTMFGQILARRICGELTDADMPLPLTNIRQPPLRIARENIYRFGSTAVHAVFDRL